MTNLKKFADEYFENFHGQKLSEEVSKTTIHECFCSRNFLTLKEENSILDLPSILFIKSKFPYSHLVSWYNLGIIIKEKKKAKGAFPDLEFNCQMWNYIFKIMLTSTQMFFQNFIVFTKYSIQAKFHVLNASLQASKFEIFT